MNENESSEVEEIQEEENLAEQIRELLADGHSGKEIIDMGYRPSTVRQEARKWAKRNSNAGNGKPPASLTVKEKEQVLPEWLEGQVSELMDGSVANQKAFVAGMAIPLLGMRMFTESIKPLGTLMQLWQAGQAEATKAAQGGSEDIAERTVVAALPYMERMVKESARASSPAPMQAMFARMFEGALTPVMQNLMGLMMPGTKQPQGQQGQQSNLPPGWVNESGEQK